MSDVTVLLRQLSQGDEGARDQLAPLVYNELKSRAESLMRRERHQESVQATVLVSDAFMRLVGGASIDWESRAHFFSLASKVMRQVLVEHARARSRQRRGGDVEVARFDETSTLTVGADRDVLALEAALEQLARIDRQQAEIVTMRFYGGMSMETIAATLGISKRNLEREWTLIKAWMRRELSR